MAGSKPTRVSTTSDGPRGSIPRTPAPQYTTNQEEKTVPTSWTPDNPEPGWKMPTAQTANLSIFKDAFANDPDNNTRKGA